MKRVNEAFSLEDNDHITFEPGDTFECCVFEGVNFWDCDGDVRFYECSFDNVCTFHYCAGFQFRRCDVSFKSFKECGNVLLDGCRIYECHMPVNDWYKFHPFYQSLVTKCALIPEGKSEEVVEC